MARYFNFFILLGVIAALTVVFYRVMVSFLIPMFLAAVLVVVFRPMHVWILRETGRRQTLAASLSTFVIALIVLAPMTLLFVLAANEGQTAMRRFTPDTIAVQSLRIRDALGFTIPYIQELREVESHLVDISNAVTRGDQAVDLKRQVRATIQISKTLADKNQYSMEPLEPEAESALAIFTPPTNAELWGHYLHDLAQFELAIDAVETAKTADVGAANSKLRLGTPGSSEPVRTRAEIKSGETGGEPTSLGEPQKLPSVVGGVPSSSTGDSPKLNGQESPEPFNSPPSSVMRSASFSAEETGRAEVESQNDSSADNSRQQSTEAQDDGTGDLTTAADNAGEPEEPVLTVEQASRELLRTFEEFRTSYCGGKAWSWLKLSLNPTPEQFEEYSKSTGRYLREMIIPIGGFFGRTLFGLTIMFISLFFFLLDGPKMIDGLRSLSPLDDEHERELIEEFEKVSRAVVVATLAAAMAQGLLAGLGFYFSGIDNVFLLTLLAMAMALVPFVGAASVWIPAAAWLYFVENRFGAAIGLAIWGGAVVSWVDNLIKPMVLHGQSNIHPLIALLSVLGGVAALGPIGILVGPMVVVFLQTVLKILQQELARLDEQRAPNANQLGAVAAAGVGSEGVEAEFHKAEPNSPQSSPTLPAASTPRRGKKKRH